MILGYLDKEDRAYDLNFATLRLRIRIESEKPLGTFVAFAPAGGGPGSRYRVLGEADVSASVAMDHGGDRVPLLRPVEGHLVRHERGLLFLATPAKRDADDPSFFLVKLRALPNAVRFFFEDQEGTEIISVPDDEVLATATEGGSVLVTVSAANVALPHEKLAYAVAFSPAATGAPLLKGLRRSRGA